MGVLLTAFQGTVPSGTYGKGIPPGTRIEEVRVNGGPGYWIEGDPHNFIYLDSRGQGRTETIRLAGRLTEESVPPEVRDELLRAFRSWKDA